MTVNTKEITSGPYPGNDIADTFSYGFRVFDKNQVIVIEEDDSGVMTTLDVDTDFSVSGISDPDGGLLTRLAGPLPTGYTWYIRSNYEETQLTAFSSQGPFFPFIHEDAFDKLTYLVQQILETQGRTLRHPFPSGSYDAGGRRIVNLGGYVDLTDAVNAQDVADIISQSEVSGGSIVSETPPAPPIADQRWTRCSDMKSFIWYVDEDGGQWVEDNPSLGGTNTVDLPTFADEAAALAGGLATDSLYKTATGEVRIKL